MKHKTFIISCILTMMTVFASSESVAQVTYQDYLRADAVMSYSNYVYSAAVEPHWLGDSHYFWYENNEKDGAISIFTTIRARSRDRSPKANG